MLLYPTCEQQTHHSKFRRARAPGHGVLWRPCTIRPSVLHPRLCSVVPAKLHLNVALLCRECVHSMHADKSPFLHAASQGVRCKEWPAGCCHARACIHPPVQLRGLQQRCPHQHSPCHHRHLHMSKHTTATAIPSATVRKPVIQGQCCLICPSPLACVQTCRRQVPRRLKHTAI